MYEFTTDWLTLRQHYFDMIMRSFDPRRVLEIGSFEGRSAVYFIDKLNGLQDARLICIDPWAVYWELDVLMDAIEERFDKNIATALKDTNVDFSKMKGPSIKMLSELILEDEPQFDLIYVDGSHTAVDVFADAALSFHLLKVGGVLIFDDYAAEPKPDTDIYQYPRIAIDAFKHAHADRLEPIMFGKPGDEFLSIAGGGGTTYQCYLRKTR